jgi:hypothetical protein
MRLTGLLEHIGEEHIYLSVDAAVRAFEARPAKEIIPPETVVEPEA